jgi:Fe2+ or Zn2+ uptake regulation protein
MRISTKSVRSPDMRNMLAEKTTDNASNAAVLRRTRNTVQRRAVLDAIRTLDGRHPTAAEVFAEVRRLHSQLSLATVYRALHALVEQGEIGETHIDNVARYDANVNPHHHAVCRVCGCLEDIFAPLPPAALKRFKEASTFSIDLHAIHFSGICPACAEAAGLLNK